MNIPKLRDWQVEALAEYDKYKHLNNVFSVSTGSGKSILSLHIIRDRLMEGKRCIFIVHSLSILNDFIEKATALGFDFGVMQGNNTRDIDKQFVIASTLSLKNSIFDSIFIDECHLVYKGLINFVNYNPQAEVIGYTATPFNPNMNKIFNNVICVTTAKQLTEDKVLVPLKIKVATQINLSKIGLKNGEYIDRDIEEAGNEILGDTVKFWQQYASDRKTLIFGATIKHAESITQSFLDAGIESATYCANTNEESRAEMIKQFKDSNSKLMVLTTVSALSTGFDAPIASCMVDCRPLSKSLTSFTQEVGRILRSYPGKEDALYIDSCGNWKRFGEEYVEMYCNGIDKLAEGKKDSINRAKQEKKEKKQLECPSCNSILIIGNKCMACGFVILPTIKPLEHITKDVILVDKVLGSIDTTNINKEELIWKMACKVAVTSKNPEWRAKFLYRDIYNKLPPTNWKYEITDIEVTKEFHNLVKHRTIKFLKGRLKWT